MHGSRPVGRTDTGVDVEHLLWLDDPRSSYPAVVGAKAANLARARAAGLPTLAGFTITTAVTDRWRRAVRPSEDSAPGGPLAAHLARSPVRAAWEDLSDVGRRELVVRSSSVVEDADGSSMAGMFTTVLGVDGWERFVDAVAEVLASADTVTASQVGGPDGSGREAARDDGIAADKAAFGGAGMGVLVQPFVDASYGGVLFTVDPLTGDPRRLLVSVGDSPDDIVSGRSEGVTASLTRRGRQASADGRSPAGFGWVQRRALAKVARRAERCFGAPQDIEWLVDGGGRLVLLQARPMTTSAVPSPRSPRLGPGPVAETFPDPLSRLEWDLWLEPLRQGIDEALLISGAGSRRRLGDPGRPSVVAVGGRPAVDLDLLGIGSDRPPRILDPRPRLRRVRLAWRLGRLRGALPAIAADLLDEVDAHLAEVPPPAELDDADLVSVLVTTSQTLVALHAHEVLAGILLDPSDSDGGGPTGAAVALAELARGRSEGMPEAELISRSPAVLALVPPRIDGPSEVTAAVARIEVSTRPRVRPGEPVRESGDRGTAWGPALTVARESLRMRVRWVQELQVRIAVEAGRRLARRGQIALDLHVDLLRRHLDMAEVVTAAARAVRHAPLDSVLTALGDVTFRVEPDPTDEIAAPLPAVFRLSPAGEVIADAANHGGARGVSAGRVTAPVTHDPARASGHVLVVPSLSPSLAPVLGSVAAVVAETGSPLSHLAILARERAVPVVVGVVGAATQLEDGTVVVVDGSTGEVGGT